MKKNGLTIIIPVYKIKEKYLKECIESVISHNNSKIYTILIDDGSPDDCGKICDFYAQNYDNIKVIHQKNKGVSFSRNVGINLTNTKWLTFVDPDDYVEKDTYNIILNYLNENNDIDILMFPYKTIYNNREVVDRYSNYSHILNEKEIVECKKAPFYKLYQNDIINNYSITALWNKVYNTNFLKKNNFNFLIEAKKGQDRLFNAMVFNFAEKVYYFDKGMYCYRCYSESITHKFNTNIVDLTMIEINELKRIDDTYKLNYSSYINARICTRIFSCMRLYFFHKENKKSWKEKKHDIDVFLENYKIVNNINNIDWSLLDFKEKVFVKCLKFRLYLICLLIVKVYNLKN